MARSTLKDVARRAGVSPATVSYVLSGKRTISEDTKRRVREAVEALDYVPDLAARGLSRRDSMLIGVVVPQTEPGDRLMFQNSFYSEVLGSIEYYARQCGYHILISATDANESYLTLAKQRNLDGIIVIGMYPDEFYQQMKKTQIPIVLIDSYCNDHYYNNIRIDDAYGSYLATRYLLDCGHRDAAFFAGQLKENGVMKKRLAGYRQALEEFGVPYRESFVFEGQIDYKSGVAMAASLARSSLGATAVVAAADILAIGAVQRLLRRGTARSGGHVHHRLRRPGDIAIPGAGAHDDKAADIPQRPAGRGTAARTHSRPESLEAGGDTAPQAHRARLG